MRWQRNNPSSTMNNQSNKVAQKEIEASQNQTQRHGRLWLKWQRIQIAVMKISMRYKKTQKDSSVNLGIKLLNKRSTFTKNLKL